MTDVEKQVKIALRLAEHERAIGALYGTFARNVPRFHTFWERIAAQEEHHAQALEDLAREVKEGMIAVDPDCFRTEAIEASFDYIRQREADTLAHGIAPKTAFNVGATIEGLLLEHDYFKVFKGASTDSQTIIEYLDRQNAEHHDMMNLGCKPFGGLRLGIRMLFA